MKTMAAGVFKARCLQVMDQVKATRTPVIITKRGKPIAKLVAVDPPAFDFPVRLHHIADATGLTPVHVSKVLSGFRRAPEPPLAGGAGYGRPRPHRASALIWRTRRNQRRAIPLSCGTRAEIMSRPASV